MNGVKKGKRETNTVPNVCIYIKLGLPKTPFKIKLSSMDILLLKSSKIWLIDYFFRIRNEMSIYAYSFKSIPIEIDKKKSIFYYNKLQL
jgi:hypothetical protein